MNIHTVEKAGAILKVCTCAIGQDHHESEQAAA